MRLPIYNQRADYSLTLLLLIFIMFLSLNTYSQTTIIKGKVSNDQGEPVPNASIALKGSNRAVTTDAKGAFVFPNVDKHAILIISSVGYEYLEYKINGKSSLTIQLKISANKMDEVEVVSSGYQDIPKERATGSFVKIDNATLNQQTGVNILNRLEGVTSGLLFETGKQNNNPQNKTNISIRGLSTIHGPLDPLIVVDGFIYEGNIENINPNNIDNVTILKDAAAASIWGARAGNGVIVITTKRGKFNQRLQIDANANIIVTEKPDLFSVPQMSSADYIDFEQLLFNNDYFSSMIDTEYGALTPAVSIFLKTKNGQITPADSAVQINALKKIDGRNDYNKYIYSNAVTQQYSVNLRGGNTNNAYTFSVGYDRNISDLHARSEKLNIKLENVYRPAKNLQILLGTYYTNSRGGAGRSGYNSLSINGRQAPYIRLADDAGNPVSVPLAYRDEYTDTVGGGKLLNWKYYPLEDNDHVKRKSVLEEYFTVLGLQYNISRFIALDIKYQYQKQQMEYEQFYNIENYSVRNIINQYSQLNRETGVVTYGIPVGGMRSLSGSTVQSHTGRAQLTFNHSWKNHDISAIFGSEIRQAQTMGNSNTTYGYNDDPLTYANTDFVNYYPTFITGSLQAIQNAPSYSNIINRFISLYANGSYTFKNKYTLSLSGRKDGSNLFGVNTNDRWRPLWSAGAGWKISSESFYKMPFIPLLKLRATYGYSGNVDLSRSAVAVGSYAAASTINLPYVQLVRPQNPSLRWEIIGMLNIGIDFELKDQTLTGSFEYYYKKGTDLYGSAPYDYTSWGGGRELMRNVANMKGSGIDVILNSKNINKTFKWNSSLLFNYNKSVTTKYLGEIGQSIASIVGGGSSISPVVGKPLYAIAAYQWGGLDASGNPQGFVNGELSTDYPAIQMETAKTEKGNIVYVGPSSPAVFGSLINSFSFRRISLSINLLYKMGYYFRKPVIDYWQLVSQGIGHADYEKRWQNPGDELLTNVPSFSYPAVQNRESFYALSEVNVLKADHIKIQYINISYSLTKKNVKNDQLKRDIQVYANASNLGILWRANKEGLNPDNPSGFRPSRSWAIGIRANF